MTPELIILWHGFYESLEGPTGMSSLEGEIPKQLASLVPTTTSPLPLLASATSSLSSKLRASQPGTWWLYLVDI